jgi:hypothetical protein
MKSKVTPEKIGPTTTEVFFNDVIAAPVEPVKTAAAAKKAAKKK